MHVAERAQVEQKTARLLLDEASALIEKARLLVADPDVELARLHIREASARLRQSEARTSTKQPRFLTNISTPVTSQGGTFPQTPSLSPLNNGH